MGDKIRLCSHKAHNGKNRNNRNDGKSTFVMCSSCDGFDSECRYYSLFHHEAETDKILQWEIFNE